MGFLDKAKAAARDAVDKHGDKIEKAVDKGVAAADKKTGGKHTEKLDKAAAQAKKALDGLDGKNDDFRKR